MVDNSTNSTTVSLGSSLSQFFTTFIVYGIVAAIRIIAFILIRNKFKRIYEPKTFIGDEKKRVKPLSRSFYGWFIDLIRVPQEELIVKCGLDAYFFARYLSVHAIFFLCSFIGIGLILIPVYLIDGKGSAYGVTGLDFLTFGNLSPSSTSRYGAPLAVAYVFIGTFLFILSREVKRFVIQRQSLLRSSTYECLSSRRTILVTGIPKEYVSTDVLLEIFNQFPGGVKHIHLNRRLKQIIKKDHQRSKLVNKLETIECQMIKNALKKGIEFVSKDKRPTMRVGSFLCFGEKVDGIDYCKENISQLNNQIEEDRKGFDDYPLINSAFIEFNKRIGADMALQSVVSSFPLAMTGRYLIINPTNIIWSNLKFTYLEQKFRQMLVLIIIGVLLFFWTIPVTFIGLLSNVNYLTNKLKFLEFILKTPPPLRGYLTGFIPSYLLVHLMSLLVMILTFLAKQTRLPTKDAIDRYVQNSFFVFQVIHVFLIVTISSSFASVITSIINSPKSAARILATNIPTSSNFFFSFLVLKGLKISSIVLLQFDNLMLFYFFGRFFDNTPRKILKRYSTLPSLNWGALYPVFTNFVVITVVYSIIAPLILLISGLVLSIIYISYKYRMFYVADFRNDVGGLSFARAIFHSFTGIYLMELMLAGLFFLATDTSGSYVALPQGILMCILIVITIGVQYLIRSSFSSLTHYLPADVQVYQRLIDPKDEMTVETVIVDESNSYIHPVLYSSKPIIWIANDNLGIAQGEIEQTHSSGLNILMSSEGAHFNDKFKIEVDARIRH